MLKRIAKALAIILALLVVVGLGLFWYGMRVVLDGGGTPQLAIQRGDRAAELARHREAQRTQSPPPPTGVPAAAEAPSAAPVAAAPAAPAAPPYWTDFRGPRRDGHYRERAIRVDWPSAGLTPVWKQPIGGGYASFVGAGGRAFTIEQRGRQEVVASYDVATGREVWTHSWAALFTEMMGGDGPRATPTWHAGTLFALGASGELRALEAASGRLLWRTNILEDAGASNLQWGMAAAPLVVGDNVVVLPGGANGNSVVAYNMKSGRRAWSALDDAASYASPMLVKVAGVEQILVFTASRLVALAPATRDVLWEFPWKTQYGVNASQPLLIGDDRVFISTGYGSGAALLQITREGDRLSARELWRTNRMKNQFTSSVLHDGYIYGLDEAILACLDAATGDLKWKGGRYGYGQVMLAEGHLIVVTEQGELALVRATPEGHRERTRFQSVDGKSWNHPALIDGYLLVRNINEMAAYDLRRQGSY